MAFVPKVVVYVPTEEWRALQARGEEPSVWVRSLVKDALSEPAVSEAPSRVTSDPPVQGSTAEPKVVAGSVSASGGEPAATGAASGGEDEVVSHETFGATLSESPPDEDPPPAGCLDHRGDPEDWCEACLALEVP